MNKEYIERETARLAYEMSLKNNNHVVEGASAIHIQEHRHILHILNKIPAADVVEVRHGRWEKVIPTKSAAKWSTKVSCSQCHGQGYERYNYCPNCGAIMDL